VLAISVDSRERNREFAESLGLTFPILSDEEKIVSRAYGVLIPILRWANRVTFVIDKQGVIRDIIRGSAAFDPAVALSACALPSHPGTGRGPARR
jgi:peroxiredoxin